jgi:hypothetical protein
MSVCGQLQLAVQHLLEMLLCALRFMGGGEMGASGFRLLGADDDDGFGGVMVGGNWRPVSRHLFVICPKVDQKRQLGDLRWQKGSSGSSKLNL